MDSCVAELNDFLKNRFIKSYFRKQQESLIFETVNKLKRCKRGQKFIPNSYANDLLDKILSIGETNKKKEMIDFCKFYEKHIIQCDFFTKIINNKQHNAIIDIEIPLNTCSLETTLKQIENIYYDNINNLKRDIIAKNQFSYSEQSQTSKESSNLSTSKPRHINFPENKFFIHKVLQEGMDVSKDQYFSIKNDTRRSSRVFKPSRIVRDILENITFAENSKKTMKANDYAPEVSINQPYNGITEIADQIKNDNIIINGFIQRPKAFEENSSKPPLKSIVNNSVRSRLKPTDGYFICPYNPCYFRSPFMSSILRHITFMHKDKAMPLYPNSEIRQYCKRHSSGCYVCTVPDCYFESAIKFRVMKHLLEFHDGTARKRRNETLHSSRSMPNNCRDHNITDQTGLRRGSGGLTNGTHDSIDDVIEEVLVDRAGGRKVGPRVKYVSRRRETVYPLATFPPFVPETPVTPTDPSCPSPPSSASSPRGSPVGVCLIDGLSALPFREKEKLKLHWTMEKDMLHPDEIPVYHNGTPQHLAKDVPKAVNIPPNHHHHHAVKVRLRRNSVHLKANRKPINKIFAPLLDRRADPELPPSDGDDLLEYSPRHRPLPPPVRGVGRPRGRSKFFRGRRFEDKALGQWRKRASAVRLKLFTQKDHVTLRINGVVGRESDACYPLVAASQISEETGGQVKTGPLVAQNFLVLPEAKPDSCGLLTLLTDRLCRQALQALPKFPEYTTEFDVRLQVFTCMEDILRKLSDTS